MAKWMKRIAITTLLCGVVMVALYYYNLTDYEDRLYTSNTVITDVFPGSEISASLSARSKRWREEEGMIVWGNPYKITISVSGKKNIAGESVKITNIRLTETDTGKVIHQTDTTFIRDFKWYDYYGMSLASFYPPKFDIPYTDCTLHFDLVAEGPWGIKDASIEIPFERKFRAYQGIPAYEGLKGL
jgi:hypothetical protein